jgi:hypothetical protein
VWPGTSPARYHANAAVTEHCAMRKDRWFHRSTRRTAEARLRRTVRSLRPKARSFIRCIELLVSMASWSPVGASLSPLPASESSPGIEPGLHLAD